MASHKGNTKEFRELTFSEQAKSISAMINNLKAGIDAHVECSSNPVDTYKKCLGQLKRMLKRIED